MSSSPPSKDLGFDPPEVKWWNRRLKLTSFTYIRVKQINVCPPVLHHRSTFTTDWPLGCIPMTSGVLKSKTNGTNVLENGSRTSPRYHPHKTAEQAAEIRERAFFVFDEKRTAGHGGLVTTRPAFQVSEFRAPLASAPVRHVPWPTALAWRQTVGRPPHPPGADLLSGPVKQQKDSQRKEAEG
jgi:hypothetical protein